ncbi:MAG TPA: AAA family ATPase [Symbiobacteriaceae bacterium]|nr:AAA family ATPase [Symbiobacteriaceae bacterium]
MRIDELTLTAFGRFRGLRLQPAPGLNIIYGENEAGKSTLQKFILAMLYGFKKPGGRREYTADAERLRPWTGADYRGSLVYTLGTGRSFRVERLFEPGRDMSRVFDAATGADLTATFPLDRRKELLFAEAHFGLNEEAFRSTAWVGQLSVGKVDSGRELVARVGNLQESGREDLSVREALAWLDEQVREIGSEKAATKPYGRVVKAMAARRGELERAEAVREEMRGWETAQTELQAVLTELDAELAAARGQMSRALLAEAEDRLRRVLEGTERIRQLQAEAEALAAYAEFPADGLLRLQQLEHLQADAEGAAAGWRERALSLAAEAAALGGGGTMALHGAAAVRALEAAEAAERGAAARLGALRQGAGRLAAEAAALGPGGLAPAAGWVWVAAAALVAGFLGYAVSPAARAAVAAAGAAVVAGLAAWLWFRQHALRHERAAARRDGLLAQAAALEAEAAALEQEVERHQGEAARQIALAGARGPADLREAYTQWRTGREQALSLERQAADAVRRADAEGARASRAAASAAALLAEAGVESAADFAAACARREARERALAEARALEAALGALLGDATPETLTAQVAELKANVDPAGSAPAKSSAALQEEIRHLEARRAELSVRAGEIGARLETALRDVADPADLRRDLEALTEEKAGYDEELAALELARTTIEAVSGDMHREFAPRLNRALSGAVAAVTGARYRAAQVDEHAGIRLLTPDDRTLEPEQLSAGTADQLYLALRVALLDLVTAGQEPLPLLLDDPFVQYDDRRAAAALAFLADMARGRQVLLMTCHRREVELARQTGVPVQVTAIGDAAAEE